MDGHAIGRITINLMMRGIKVTWIPDIWEPGSEPIQKFTYNTNMRHEDEMGRDLDFKDLDSLCEEFLHCIEPNKSLVIQIHNIESGPHRFGKTIYYDRST